MVKLTVVPVIPLALSEVPVLAGWLPMSVSGWSEPFSDKHSDLYAVRQI